MTRTDNSRSRTPILVASAAVTVLVLAALLVLVEWSEVRAVLRMIDAAWLAAAAAASLLALALRALRLRELLPPVDPRRQTWLRYLRATLLHQGIFALAPSGTGDIALPVIARLHLGLPWRDAAASLVVARSLDVVALAALSTVAATAIWLGSLAAVLLGALLIVLLPPSFRVAGDWGGRLAARLLRQRGERAGAGARPPSPSMIAMATTLAAWCAAGAMIGLVLTALGRPPGLAESMLLLAVLNVAGALALVTFAGIGFSDLGLAGALVLLGYGPGEAIAVALAARILLLALGAVLPLVLELMLAGGAMLSRRPVPVDANREP